MTISLHSPTQDLGRRTAVPEIVDKMRQFIERGEWREGQELPSVRQLASDWRVSSNTITAAQSLLEQDGTLRRVARKGVFVRERNLLCNKPILLLGDMQTFHHGESRWQHVTVGTLQEINSRQLQFEWPPWDPVAQCTNWEHAKQMILDRKGEISGVILPWAVCGEDELRHLIRTADIPIVKVGRHSRRCRHNYVAVDYFAAGQLSHEKVKGLIRDRVLVVSADSPHDYPRRQLIGGFVDGLLEQRNELVRCDSLWLPTESDERRQERLTEYFTSHPPPQVIYATGDLLAIYVMRVLQQQGYRVPEDVSIVGSTGLEVAKHCQPSLAHVCQPLEELGAHAVAMLVRLAETPGHWAAGVELPVAWVPGGSVVPGEASAES